MENVLVALPSKSLRRVCTDALKHKCNLIFLGDVAGKARQRALESADILIAGHVAKEITSTEAALLKRVRFIQLLHAGADHIHFSLLPAGVPVACTKGKGAPIMSEHIVAMALCCSRRLLIEDRNMRAGNFNMYGGGLRVLGGRTCAILGFGGVGRAAARIFRAMGMRIVAINRSGRTNEDVDFIGTLTDLETVLREADLIVVTLPLTRATSGLIGASELTWTKDDAILVNVSRAEIFDQGALYEHLIAHPRFFAALDVWWVEPFRHGQFRTDHPFLELSNVVASPHNSAQAEDSDLGLSLTLDNVCWVLNGNPPRMLIKDDEKFL